MNIQNDQMLRALASLEELVALGPRFHGTAGIVAAQNLLQRWLEASGATVTAQEVRTPGWDPGAGCLVRLTVPVERTLIAWPMLWSGAATGLLTGTLAAVGVQGLWGDSILWTKFVLRDDAGTVLAYVHARDEGPAAPQPLPLGSDTSVPHMAISHVDGLALTEWLSDGFEVTVDVSCDAAHAGEAVSSNLIVEIPGRVGGTGGRVIVTGHYDTFFNTPGAYDNGSGTIALVHLAQLLIETPPQRPVTLIWTTAEEWHLAGSRRYVDGLSLEEREELDFALNIDGLGRGDFMEVFAGPETFERTFLDVLGEYTRAERPALRVQSRFPPTCGTDQGSFYAAGIPVAYFTINDLHRLHQPEDLPNPQIAANIAWSVPLIAHLIDTLPRADKVPDGALSIPF